MPLSSPSVDPLDDVFPDPDGTIAGLVAALPAPAPDRAARVCSLLSTPDPVVDGLRRVLRGAA